MRGSHVESFRFGSYIISHSTLGENSPDEFPQLTLIVFDRMPKHPKIQHKVAIVTINNDNKIVTMNNDNKIVTMNNKNEDEKEKDKDEEDNEDENGTQNEDKNENKKYYEFRMTLEPAIEEGYLPSDMALIMKACTSTYAAPCPLHHAMYKVTEKDPGIIVQSTFQLYFAELLKFRELVADRLGQETVPAEKFKALLPTPPDKQELPATQATSGGKQDPRRSSRVMNQGLAGRGKNTATVTESSRGRRGEGSSTEATEAARGTRKKRS